jgi:hypothetical protein
MYIKTGFMNETQTKEIMAQTVRIVKGILGDMCMPNHILQPPKFVSLEFVKWTPPDSRITDHNDDDNDDCIYTMRLTVAIQRVDFNTAQTIVDILGDAIYENGAMFPFTIATEYRRMHHTFLYPPNSLLDTRPIRTTTATIHLNMGYMDGTQENIMTVDHARANQDIITHHVTDCIPDPDDLDLDDPVQQIKFVSLEFVQWTPPEDETVWAHDDCMDSDPAARVARVARVTYTMQLTVAIHHEHPVAFNTVQSIVDAIYENGAMFPSTLTLDEDREISHTFLYPYHSNFSGLENGLCLGE